MENELYKKMYLHLFNAVTDAINEPNHIKRIEIMKQAQIDTEEMYISHCVSNISHAKAYITNPSGFISLNKNRGSLQKE